MTDSTDSVVPYTSDEQPAVRQPGATVAGGQDTHDLRAQAVSDRVQERFEPAVVRGLGNALAR
jgi:hypothetical protein